ncbi:type II toxin-antitoxin system RelE family toxin [Homoserinimonas sp. A447]
MSERRPSGSWRIETTAEFDRSIRKLDRAVARRIIDYLEAVQQLDDPRQRGKALTGEKRGYWRYRVGDFRVLVSVEDERMVVLAIGVGHRSEVYRDSN